MHWKTGLCSNRPGWIASLLCGILLRCCFLVHASEQASINRMGLDRDEIDLVEFFRLPQYLLMDDNPADIPQKCGHGNGLDETVIQLRLSASFRL